MLLNVNYNTCIIFKSRARDSTPRFIRRLVGWLVPILLFLAFLSFLSSLLNTQVTSSITAPAHPHASGVAVYPAFFLVRNMFPRD